MRLKKRRGIFYTRSDLTDVLVAWSIRSPNDTALEPSFGGCGFVTALRTRLSSLGHISPLKNIFGCDVDRTAFSQHLPLSFSDKKREGHFLKADFLSLKPVDFGGKKFTAVIGNPPYVSQHNMYRAQRKSAVAIRKDSSFVLSSMASLWAFFVFHALRFLENGGRMAWVLPGSLLHSNYAKELLHELSTRFEAVTVISLSERIFVDEGVAESTQVLLCDDLKATRQSGKVEVKIAEDVKACASLLQHWQTRRWSGNILNGRAVPALVGEDALKIFSTIASKCDVSTLGDLAEFRIGIVTGANRLFIIDDETARKHDLPQECLRPILAKFSTAPGIGLTTGDIKRARAENARCLFVDRRMAPYSKRVQQYFAAFPQAAHAANVTFKKYSDWRCPDDRKIPDAFFPYMHHSGPRLVLNTAKLNATNTIHRAYFKANVSHKQRQDIALSLLSTFSQISAELEGRSYGGGVLKHEPSEARCIKLLLPRFRDGVARRTLVKAVDVLLRDGRIAEARKLVDEEVFATVPDHVSRTDRNKLDSLLSSLRARRHLRKE